MPVSMHSFVQTCGAVSLSETGKSKLEKVGSSTNSAPTQAAKPDKPDEA
jgi:hypothetical protein